MKSPFPGMDPFIEARGLWPDFHQRLMSRIADAVSAALPEQYVARLGHRTYIDRIEDDPESSEETHFEPDVSVVQKIDGAIEHDFASMPAPRAEAGAILMHAAVADGEVKEAYLDIFDLNPDRRLITSVEVLSPANKRFRGTGWKQYRRKRDLLLKGRANLVEVDLLRRGRRHPMNEPWPESPYYVLVSKKWEAPACHVWPAFSTVALPDLRVPLDRGDGELVVPLQSCVAAVYASSHYERDIKYDERITPPLTDREQSLLMSRAAG